MGIAVRLGTLGCIGVFVAGLSVTMPTRAAQANQCLFSGPSNVKIALTRNEGPVQFNNKRSQNELKRMQQRNGTSQAFGAGWTPVGLTLTELKYNMRVSIEALKMGPNNYCARLTKVEAKIGYDKFDVFIARKFRPSTCAYDSIRAHESTHVSIFKSGLDEFYPRMRHRLERASGAMGTIKVGSPKVAAKLLQQRLRHTIDPLFKEMNRTLNRRNGLLDTPERYRSEQARCTDW